MLLERPPVHNAEHIAQDKKEMKLSHQKCADTMLSNPRETIEQW